MVTNEMLVRNCFILTFAAFVISTGANAAAGVACSVKGVESGAPILCGVASQGGMLYGEAEGWQVFNGQEKISKDGVFVIGMDRDAAKVLKLKFCKAETCKTYSYKIASREYVEQKVTVPDKFVKYPDEVQKRIDRENGEIKTARARTADDSFVQFMDLALTDELKKHPISGVFGSRRVFNGEPKSPHKGLDIAAPTGTAVGSLSAGTVVIAADMYLSGKTVFISHGHGVTSAYLHLSEINVKKGDTVAKGDIIGKVGATGRVSGAHLHLGVYWRQIALDPGLLVNR